MNTLVVNPFQDTGLFLHPLKTGATEREKISGGIEKDQWHKLD